MSLVRVFIPSTFGVAWLIQLLLVCKQLKRRGRQGMHASPFLETKPAHTFTERVVVYSICVAYLFIMNIVVKRTCIHGREVLIESQVALYSYSTHLARGVSARVPR